MHHRLFPAKQGACRRVMLMSVRTGPDFHEEAKLRDGTPVWLRHIRPEDADELKRGFERLSPESRYRRFFGAVTHLSEESLRYLTRVDGQDHVAVVAVTHAPGSTDDIGLGVARFIRLPDEPTAAEAAITVIDEAQGKGLGHLLALTLARAARERGVQRFRGEILADNDQVRQLLDEVGAVVRSEPDGRVVFDIDLDSAEEHVHSERLDVVARRILQAAAHYLIGALRKLRGPAPS